MIGSVSRDSGQKGTVGRGVIFDESAGLCSGLGLTLVSDLGNLRVILQTKLAHDGPKNDRMRDL